jgi:hypothetical protein
LRPAAIRVFHYKTFRLEWRGNMKQINQVDVTGLYIGPFIASDEQISRHLNPDDEFTLGLVVIDPIPEGFYKPKWNGLEWVEGLTEEQINFLENQPIPPTEIDLLKTEVNNGLESLDQRTLGMQEIDYYTLDQATRLDERTEGMQQIDDYSLTLIFELMARIETLEQKVQTLEGGI